MRWAATTVRPSPSRRRSSSSRAQPRARVILVGRENELTAALAKSVSPHRDRVTVRHAAEVVGMDEPPADALRRKKDSSMRVAINLVKEGEAQACVSAGNTGALMAIARFVLKTLPGMDRPAIASQLPTKKGEATVLDLGANVNCTPAAAAPVRRDGGGARLRRRPHRAPDRRPAQHRRGRDQGQRRREAGGRAAASFGPQLPRQRRGRRHLQGHHRRRGVRRVRRQRRC